MEADYENNLERFYFAGQIASTEYKGLYSASDHMKVPVGKCKNCYWDKDVVQHNFKDTTALTTAQMKKSASFVGFDFDTTWTIDEDKTYPYFKNLGKSEPAKFDTTPKTVLAGDGTKDYPYNVTSYDDLMAIGSGEYTLDKHYYQTQDIDASMSHPDSCKKHGSEFLYEPIGTGTGLFDGVYDGGGNSITNLWLQADRDTVGLFYGIGTKGTVQNLTLKAFNVQGKNYVGALAGVNSGTLSKVGVQNLVKPDECKCSYNDTIVVTEVKGIDFVGCMLGAQTGGATSQSYTVCNVEGSEHVGGFAGALSGAADNSLSKAMVLAKNIAGGFAGSADAATMDKVYAAGFVKTKGASPISGGIVGSASKSVTLTNSYYDYETTFQKGDAYGTPYTTRQMTDSSNFKNWDFSNIWCIKADTTYPYLAWAKDTLVPNEWRTGDLTMSGSGTLDDPFLVKTYEDLKKVGYAYYSLSAHYRLANDVDASASRTENCVTADSCLGFKPIGSDSTEVTSLLKGSFNGAGHTISDLYSNHHNYVGLFLGVDTTGLVDSLNLEGFEMRVDYSGAAVAAYNYGNIQNVYVRASVGTRSGKDVGGIVNENYGTISNVRFKGDLLGEEDVGGIAVLNKGVIEKASAEVAIHSLSGNYVGGLVSTNRGSIAKSFVTGTIEGDAGFVYKNSGEITACYAMADVQGVDNASGFVYENYGAISDVYAIGILSALYNSSRVAASGFGYYFGNDATVKRVYAVNTLFQTNSGSSCFTANGKAEDFLWNADLCKDSASAGAFSSTMMKKSSSYANWDFENVWDIQEGASYPYLRGMVNLPVAFADTIYTEKIPSLDELVAALLKNDFAGSENKSGLVTKLDSVSLKNFNALKKPDIGDFVQVRYRAGAILGKDTLWGNEAESYLIFGEKPVVTEIAGDGTEDSPWLIRDYDDLKMIGSGKYTLDGHYRLANDINASMSSVENCFTRDSCNGFQAFAFDTTEFTGHFHGAGHTIKNLHTNTGLVGFPGYTAVLDSLTLEVDVPNGVAIGPLGRTNYGTIQHVHVSGKIRGTIGLGGLFYANDGTMRDVSFEGSITGASHSIGGIVYSNIGSIITSKATLVANDTLIYQTGGIASINYQEGIIDSCSASGILYGSRDVGGLVAVNQGTVQHSMTSAKVKGDHAGGLVGYNNGGALRWNFSTGDVTGGTYVGGIAGINQGTISSCFSTGKVLISEETQFSYKGTLAGNNAGVIENVYAVTYDTIPLQGLGEEARLTKAFAIPADGIMREMLNADSYKDFDFDSVWFQSRGATLPNLRGMANIPYVFVDTLSVSMESEKGATAFDAGYALTTFKNSVLSLAYLENGDKNTLIFKFDSASEATVEKKKLKDGEILGFTYRLGRLIGTDTLWGPYASSAVVVEQTNGIVPALHFAMKVIRTGDMVDVRYSIPRQGHVKFVLADFQGRVLRSLSSGMKNAGSHAETMKLQGMPQGRYRIIMTVDGKVVRHFGI